MNFQKTLGCPDRASIIYGKPISAKQFVSKKRNESVVNLKTKIQVEKAKLTTDIPKENYDKILEKLDGLNVDYLNPDEVNKCIDNNFEDCTVRKSSKLNWLRSILKYLLIINLIVPYLVWKKVAQPKIKELEFTATFRFAIALTLVPIYLIIVCLVLGSVFNFTIALWYLVFSLVLALFAVKL